MVLILCRWNGQVKLSAARAARRVARIYRWALAEEMLQLAVTSFLVGLLVPSQGQASLTGWVGKVGMTYRK